MQVAPSDENDHTGSFSSFTPPRSALRNKVFRALRSATKGSAFGNRKPFIKGLTENFTVFAYKARDSSPGKIALLRALPPLISL